MQNLNSQFKALTKTQLVAECLKGDALYIVNGKPEHDKAFVEKILLNKEGKYDYSVSTSELNKEGKRLIEIKYELAYPE